MTQHTPITAPSTPTHPQIPLSHILGCGSSPAFVTLLVVVTIRSGSSHHIFGVGVLSQSRAGLLYRRLTREQQQGGMAQRLPCSRNSDLTLPDCRFRNSGSTLFQSITRFCYISMAFRQVMLSRYILLSSVDRLVLGFTSQTTSLTSQTPFASCQGRLRFHENIYLPNSGVTKERARESAATYPVRSRAHFLCIQT